MSERDQKDYWAMKTDPARYAAYLERKRKERQARKDYQRDRKRNWRAANEPHAKALRSASHAVQKALKNGTLIRPAACTRCGKSEDIQAFHYMGYAPEHRLDVVWLCKWCLPKEHAKESVPDLVKLPATSAHSNAQLGSDDTFDDMAGIDHSLLGSDGAARVLSTRSYVKRDQRVRTAVLHRAGGSCERCKATRNFPGFLDVHHILGAGKSDRVWNCVSLCPNCHREAHTAPNSDQINATLLKIAKTFKGSGKSAATDCA